MPIPVSKIREKVSSSTKIMNFLDKQKDDVLFSVSELTRELKTHRGFTGSLPEKYKVKLRTTGTGAFFYGHPEAVKEAKKELNKI